MAPISSIVEVKDPPNSFVDTTYPDDTRPRPRIPIRISHTDCFFTFISEADLTLNRLKMLCFLMKAALMSRINRKITEKTMSVRSMAAMEK